MYTLCTQMSIIMAYVYTGTKTCTCMLTWTVETKEMDHRLSALSLHAHICTHTHAAKQILYT